MERIPRFPEAQLLELCEVLGHPQSGLRPSEIGELFRQLGLADDNPTSEGRHRIYEALTTYQRRERSGTNVLAFIHAAMDPARYGRNPGLFETRRRRLDRVLAACGYTLREDGKIQMRETPTEAEARAEHLQEEMERRGAHPRVLEFCRAELLSEHCLPAVARAVDSLRDRVRETSGLASDGVLLAEQAFGFGQVGMPLLAFNTLATEAERPSRGCLRS